MVREQSESNQTVREPSESTKSIKIRVIQSEPFITASCLGRIIFPRHLSLVLQFCLRKMRSLTHMCESLRLAAPVQQYFAQKFCVASKLGPRSCAACLLARGILWILYVFKCCIFSTCILPGRLEAEEAFSSSEVKSSSLSNWRTFPTCSITGAKCPSDGKTLEKCRNANGYFSSMID